MACCEEKLMHTANKGRNEGRAGAGITQSVQ